MRIYLPTTLAELAGFVASGWVPASAERYLAEDESEESEYEALAAAADDSGDRLDGLGRRVVVVADVADPDAGFGTDRIVAVHADTDPVDPGGANLPELGWYATQEIPDLLPS